MKFLWIRPSRSKTQPQNLAAQSEHSHQDELEHENEHDVALADVDLLRNHVHVGYRDHAPNATYGHC